MNEKMKNQCGFAIMSNSECYQAKVQNAEGITGDPIMLYNVSMTDSIDDVRMAVLDTTDDDAAEAVKFMATNSNSFIIFKVSKRRYDYINKTNRQKNEKKYELTYLKPVRALAYGHEFNNSFSDVSHNPIEWYFYRNLCEYLAHHDNRFFGTRFFEADFLSRGLKTQLIEQHPELKDAAAFDDYIRQNIFTEIDTWWEMYEKQRPLDVTNMKLKFIDIPVIGHVNHAEWRRNAYESAALSLFGINTLSLDNTAISNVITTINNQEDYRCSYGYVCMEMVSGKLLFLDTEEIVKYFDFFDLSKISVAQPQADKANIAFAARTAVLSTCEISLVSDEYGPVNTYANAMYSYKRCYVKVNGYDFNGEPIVFGTNLLLAHMDWLPSCELITTSIGDGTAYILPKKSDYTINTHDIGKSYTTQSMIPVTFIDIKDDAHSCTNRERYVPLFVLMRKYKGGQCINAKFVSSGNTAETLKINIVKK